MKKTICEECGKKLGIFEGYIHPTMGKKHHICSNCYNQVSESVEKWREFVITNSFNRTPTKNINWVSLKKIKPNFKKIITVSENIQ